MLELRIFFRHRYCEGEGLFCICSHQEGFYGCRGGWDFSAFLTKCSIIDNDDDDDDDDDDANKKTNISPFRKVKLSKWDNC